MLHPFNLDLRREPPPSPTPRPTAPASPKGQEWPEDAVQLWDVIDSSPARVLDAIQTEPRHCGRFADLELAKELCRIRAIPTEQKDRFPSNMCVIIDGIGCPIVAGQEKPLLLSARDCIISLMTAGERDELKLPMSAAKSIPWEPGKRITKAYDLLIVSTATSRYTHIGRFLLRAEAEKVSSGRTAKSRATIQEVECFVSNSTAFLLGPDRRPVVSSLREAILESLAPEFRLILEPPAAEAAAEELGPFEFIESVG